MFSADYLLKNKYIQIMLIPVITVHWHRSKIHILKAQKGRKQKNILKLYLGVLLMETNLRLVLFIFQVSIFLTF